jgi:hypothetical protein
MDTKEQDTKKTTEVIPGSPTGSLLSFDEFDSFLMIFFHADGRACWTGIFLQGLTEGFQKLIFSITTMK